MQIWIHDNKMKKITALNNDIPDMLSYSNSTWHSYLDQATSTFDFTIPKFSNGELHEDIKLINDECFVSFYVNGSYQVFYIATLQEDDFNIQLTCNNTNLEYALEYANPFNSSSAQSIEWYLNHMDLLSFAAVEIGINEVSDRKRTLTFDSQETKMARLQSLMSNFDAEFEFKVELNRDGTYKRIVINIYQKADDTHHGIGSDRKDVVLYYSNGLKGVQVSSDKTQMFNAGVFTGKDGLSLADVEISEKNADGIEEFYSRKGNVCLYAPLAMARYPATMRSEGQDNWIRKDFTTEYENVNDLKAYALRTLKQYAYPLMTYTASVQSGFVNQYTDLKLGDTVRIVDKNFAGGLALEARVSEMIISFDNPNNNSLVFTNYRKIDNKPTSALQSRIDKAVEDRLPYRIELATTGGVTFKNNEGETTVKPSLYKGNLPYTTDVTWRWALDGVVTVGMQYLARAENIDGTAVLTISAYIGNNEVATTEITLTNVNDGAKGDKGNKGDKGDKGETGERGPQGIQGLQGPKGDQGIQGPKGADGKTQYTHIAYADNATGGGFSQTDQTKNYIGMYVDFTATDSTDPTKYRWTKWKGSDGVQGIPGKPGADGKTPYIHFAYADDDEGTNFSLTDKNQQYQGYYSDYTEADSTDYRKYKWVDRLANVQAGVRNLFLNSLFKRDLHAKYSTYELIDDITQTQGQLAATIDTTTKYLNSNSLKIVSTYDGTPKNQKIIFRTGGDTRTGADDEMSNKSVMMSFYAKSTVENTVFKARAGYRSEAQVLSIGTEWKYYSFQLIKPLPTNATNEVIMHIETKATIWIVRPKVEIGTLSTDYIEAPEDTQSDIDSKADQTLTQEQLNALEAKRLQMEVELKAKATLEQVSELETFVNNLKQEDTDGRQKIIEVTKAIEERVKDIEPIMEYSQKLKFMDTYITQGNGGMIIGANDSTTKVVVTPDRISFQSGGSEVAYISQRMLHIDNGVFTMSLQLGHYITRAHPKNEYVNATYFVK